MALPPLKLSDHHRSPFDEAVLLVDGREEETITIACPKSLELAHELIIYVNNHERVLAALTAAELVLGVIDKADQLRPELIDNIRHLCRELKELTGAAA